MNKLLPSAKINTTKLLPPSRSIAPSVPSNGSLVVSEKKLKIVHSQVIEIRKLLDTSLLLKKEESQKKGRQEENKEQENKEKELEKKVNGQKFNVKLPGLPKLGFLDTIKNFFINALLGYIALRLVPHINKLPMIVGAIGSAIDFSTDFLIGAVDVLGTFVQKGYEAYDFTRNQLKTFGGEGTLKLFDGFNSALNGLILGAVAAAFAFGDIGDSGADQDTVGIKGKTPGRSRRGIDPKLARRYADIYGKDAAARKFGKEGLKSLGGKYARSGAQNLARRGLVSLAGKGGTKLILKTVRPLLKRLPIVGALIDFGLSVALGENPGRAAFKAIGAGLLGSVGVAIGSVVPFVGNLVGGIVGGMAGDAIGGALYDMFFGGKKSKPPQKIKAAGGGSVPVTRGGKLVNTPVKRSAPKKQKRRSIKVKPTQVKPGSSVGGEEKIKKIFPEGEKTGTQKTVSPIDYMKNSYKKSSETPGFGGIASIFMKAQLGQKPSDIDYQNAAEGLTGWMQRTFSSEILRTGGAFAEGGEVDASMFSSDMDMKTVIAKSIQDTVTPSVDNIINDLMKQLGLKGIAPKGKDAEKAPDPDEMGEGADLVVSSDSEDFWLLATAAMFENSNPQGAADVAQVIYNRTQYSAWNASSIRKAILNPNQFQPVRQYGGTAAWSKIKTKEDAIRFAKSYGKTQQQLETVAAALLDKSKQEDARRFVGPRDSFRAIWFEDENNHLANETEVRRHGHVFGFEPGGAMIGQFKANKLSAARVSDTITGDVNFKAGDGRFIQGNSGRSSGNHFHIGTNKPGDGSGVAAAGFRVIKHFLGKKSIHVGRSRENIPTKATDEQIRGYIARGQAAHGGTELDLQIGGIVGPGTKVPFPLALKGMKYSSTDGYGVSADIVGTNAFVGHGRYKPDGTLAPQQGDVRLSLGAPDFYAFHGMNKVMTKDALLKVHKGEYISVTDADSFRLVGNILADINSIENKSQLVARVPSIIEKLKAISGYAPYEDDSDQVIEVEVPAPQVVPMMMPVPVNNGLSGGFNSSVDPTYDSLYGQS